MRKGRRKAITRQIAMLDPTCHLSALEFGHTSLLLTHCNIFNYLCPLARAGRKLIASIFLGTINLFLHTTTLCSPLTNCERMWKPLRRIVGPRRLPIPIVVRSASSSGVPPVRQPQKASKRDITGSKLSHASRDGLTMIDEAIMNMITFEDDPLPQIRECLRLDPDCALAHALRVLELCRSPTVRDEGVNDEEITLSLKNLERNFLHLNERERFLGAAGLQWFAGNFSNAAALLESAIMVNPGDAISLRLAQDCYMQAGDTKNVLSCVTRCLQTLDDGHFLHGHLMGMMSTGYVENNCLAEAEETAARAVARTKGRDICALHAYLNTLQLAGRSSELLSVLEKHEAKFDGATGLLLLFFNKGCAFVQRGNYRGAARVYDSMLEFLSEADAPPVSGLTHASLLLWYITLYSSSGDRALYDRWRSPDLFHLWQGVDMHRGGQMTAVAMAVALSFGGMHREQWDQLTKRDEDEREQTSMKDKKEPTEGGGMDGILSWLTKQQVSSTENADIEEVQEGGGDSAEADTSSRGEALEQLLRVLRAPSTSAVDTLSDFEMLAKTQPSFALETRAPELIAATASTSERDWLVTSSVEPVVAALAAQAKLDHVQAAKQLNSVHPVRTRLGGSATQRDLLAHALIFAFLRTDRVVEARFLLCERAALSPNEAQSWRKLAMVFDKMGERDLAEVAHYTAWQLGIGQGGFGGPR